MHTVRYKPPLSLSYNHSSYLFEDTFERNPLLITSTISSKCCCCCYYYDNISVYNRLGEVNPSYLSKGFSQSTLIKWSNSKRFYGFLPFSNLNRSSYNEKFGAFKEIKKHKQRGFWYDREKQFLSSMSDDYANDVEVMISLLTNEMDLEYVDVKDRKKISKEKKKVGSEVVKRDFKRHKGEKIPALTKSENLDLSRDSSSGEELEVKYDSYVNDVEVMLSLLTNEMDLESADVKDRKKINKERKKVGSRVVKGDFKRDKVEKIQALSKSENLDLTKGENFEVKCDGYVGKTSSSQYIKDSQKDCKTCNDKEFVQEKDEVLEKKDVVKAVYEESVGVRQDWRKKSEKKLNEEFCQHEPNIVIDPCRHYNYEVEKVSDESGSRTKYKRFEEMSNNDKSVIESKKKLIMDMETSKMHEPDMRGTYSLSESRIKSLKEKSTEVNDQIKKDNVEDIDTISDMKVAEVVGGSRSSSGSGPKGPSDEMWHVTDTSTQDPYETDTPDNVSDLSEHGEPVKTSGRSLWTVIGDVVRLHWKSPMSGSHTPNSGDAKGSSYMSASSETWFTSHDSNDENKKKKSIKGASSPYNNVGPSRSSSLTIIKESSPKIKRTSEVEETYKSVNDSMNGELKKRKVVHKAEEICKDNFDEWEKAYNFEANQRKIDEMFMKEALLEAKKAADVWEVPVGAVLVKDGQIITRGHNLVEELRDSTAHAELICIRKASTNLQTWRLLDTTLYVTLEPCPMCAGAILQARIDRVVWGAPNKLLGADGSWIRLLSDSNGASGSMETDMPPAPAHPFHPHISVTRGVLAVECAEVMQNFFRLRRSKKTGPTPAPEPLTPPSVTISHHDNPHHSNFLSKIHDAFKIIFCL
ncbi:uncharacterized protein [Rutidosis leptorrhynchoides]|uniref:uncharacterized protein n=1 Tax=Rutidosis leptorrhynchoides TaxID=125765 RepID=UPI003A9A0E06